MRAVIALTLALALGLAGCASRDVPVATEAASGEGIEPAVQVDLALPDGAGPESASGVPVWRVGDAWAITPLGEDDAEPGFLVVTSADAGTYTLQPTSGSLASYDAMFDVSFVGKIRARDLAGHQQGAPIQFFDFPLSDGKTWTTTWDGREVALAATATPRGFDITGTVDGAPFVAYDFDPGMRWWSKLLFAEGYGLQVTRFVEGWTGELAIATAKVVFESGPAVPIASGGVAAFTVDEGQDLVLLSVTGGGVLWLRGFMLFDPSGTPYLTSNTTNLQLSEGVGEASAYRYQDELPPTPGAWHVANPVLHSPDAAGHVIIHEVAIATKAFP